MQTISDLIACVRHQRISILERFARDITSVVITPRVPVGSTVVAYANPTQLLINNADAMRLAICGDPIPGVKFTFMGMTIFWDLAA